MEKKILVVDDEKIILDLFNDLFKTSGFDVILASGAKEALDILEKEEISLMFLDLKLPGMNGLELCRIIRKNNANSIIYAITGYSSLFEHAECLAAGFDNYFRKPCDPLDLIRAVEDGFDKLEKSD